MRENDSMIRYKKIVSIAMPMVVMATAFSTNVFAGGFCRCCKQKSPAKGGAGRHYETMSTCSPSTDSTKDKLVIKCDSIKITDKNNNTSFSFNTKSGKLEVNNCGGKMHDFSSIRMPR